MIAQRQVVNMQRLNQSASFEDRLRSYRSDLDVTTREKSKCSPENSKKWHSLQNSACVYVSLLTCKRETANIVIIPAKHQHVSIILGGHVSMLTLSN